jgi:hypothetical protein
MYTDTVKILNKFSWILFELMILKQSLHLKAWPTDRRCGTATRSVVDDAGKNHSACRCSNKTNCYLQYINKLLIIYLKHQLLIMIKTPKWIFS